MCERKFVRGYRSLIVGRAPQTPYAKYKMGRGAISV